MGVRFRWYAGGSQLAGPGSPQRRWRPSPLLVALAFAALAAAGTVSWAAERGLRAARSDLQRQVDQEVVALRTGQLQDLLGLLDDRYSPWVRYHQDAFEREAAWYMRYSGCRVVVEDVRLRRESATVRVVLHGPGACGARSAVWYYQRTAAGWRHAPPPLDYWGQATDVVTPHVTLTVQGPDRALASGLASELEDLYVRLAETYRVLPVAGEHAMGPRPARACIRIFPYGIGTQAQDAVTSPQLALELWTPDERYASLGRDLRLAVARSVLNRLPGGSRTRTGDWWLLEGLALWHASAWEPEWEASVRESLADGSYRQLLDIRPYTPTSAPLAWQMHALPPDDAWAQPLAYTLGGFLASSFPPEQLQALLQALASAGSGRTNVLNVLGLSRPDLEAAWASYLQGRFSGS